MESSDWELIETITKTKAEAEVNRHKNRALAHDPQLYLIFGVIIFLGIIFYASYHFQPQIDKLQEQIDIIEVPATTYKNVGVLPCNITNALDGEWECEGWKIECIEWEEDVTSYFEQVITSREIILKNVTSVQFNDNECILRKIDEENQNHIYICYETKKSCIKEALVRDVR